MRRDTILPFFALAEKAVAHNRLNSTRVGPCVWLIKCPINPGAKTKRQLLKL